MTAAPLSVNGIEALLAEAQRVDAGILQKEAADALAPLEQAQAAEADAEKSVSDLLAARAALNEKAAHLQRSIKETRDEAYALMLADPDSKRTPGLLQKLDPLERQHALVMRALEHGAVSATPRAELALLNAKAETLRAAQAWLRADALPKVKSFLAIASEMKAADPDARVELGPESYPGRAAKRLAELREQELRLQDDKQQIITFLKARQGGAVNE